VVPRRQIAEDIKALGQDERAQLRKHGVRFGQHNIFMPLLLKPAPTRLRLILWSLWEGFEVFAEAPPPGMVTIPALADAPRGYYERVGYRLCGTRALRIDMLERLADMIRPMDARAGFEATADMLSITGCTLEQLADIMKSLGLEGERGERPKPVRPARVIATEGVADVAPALAEGAAPEADADETAEIELAEPDIQSELPAAEPEAASEAEPASAPSSVEDAIIAPEAEIAKTGAAEAGGTEAEVTETTSGEAGETEIFYTFKLRPRHQPGSGAPRRPEANGGQAEGETGGERRARSGGKSGANPDRKPGRSPGEKGKGRAAGKGPRRDRNDSSRPDQASAARKPAPERQPRAEKPLDPLSPFAILQQLKDK